MSAPVSGEPAAPPGGRAARRRAERATQRQARRRRRRVVLGTIAVAAVLVAGVVLLSPVGRGHRNPAGTGGGGRTQATLLFQVRGPYGAAVESALLAHDPRRERGAMVLVPSRVVVDVPGNGLLPFGRALALPDPALPRAALSDLLGVTVDASWVLDSAGLARLVDQVGGVTVDVDRDVLRPAPDGGATVVVRSGPRQRLAGPVAVACATYLGAGEQELARLPRLQAVLGGLLAALPATGVGDLIAGVGVGVGVGTGSAPSSSPSSSPPALAGLLTGLAADQRRDDLTAATLPVQAIDTGGGDSAYGIDEDAVRRLVDRTLADSLLPGARAGGNRVLVLNGVGTPEIGKSVRDRLDTVGFVYVGSRNAANFGYAQSQVLVFDPTPEAAAVGERVAAALGLPPAALRVSPRGQSVADVLVILGADFRP